MYKQDLVLNNLQGLICPKTQPTIKFLELIPKISTNAHSEKLLTHPTLSLSLSLYIYIYIYIYMCACVRVCVNTLLKRISFSIRSIINDIRGVYDNFPDFFRMGI